MSKRREVTFSVYIYIQTGTCSQSLILHDYFYNTLPPAEPGGDRQSAAEAFDLLVSKGPYFTELKVNRKKGRGIITQFKVLTNYP